MSNSAFFYIKKNLQRNNKLMFTSFCMSPAHIHPVTFKTRFPSENNKHKHERTLHTRSPIILLTCRAEMQLCEGGGERKQT